MSPDPTPKGFPQQLTIKPRDPLEARATWPSTSTQMTVLQPIPLAGMCPEDDQGEAMPSSPPALGVPRPAPQSFLGSRCYILFLGMLAGSDYLV